ncbi:MAG TPA: GAF domain-containing protein, partial [Nitrospirae bacterium]|nr:GAF domain-containing protein [Nitrospirota bacterium]
MGTGLFRYIKARPHVPEWKSLEFLLPLLLIVESVIQFLGAPLLHLIYIPFIVVITGYFPLKIIVSCVIAILLLGAPTLWWIDIYPFQTVHLVSSVHPGPDSLIWVYLSIVTTGILSYSIFYWKTKISKKALAELEQLKSSAINLESSIESDIFHEDRFSHAVKSILETQEELSAMLILVKKALNTDSATLFTLEQDELVIKTSTEDIKAQPTYAEKGYLSGIIKEKTPVIQTKLKGGFFGLRYRHSDEAGSFLCVPVLDGNVPLGAIVVDSHRGDAFGDREKDIVSEFAVQTKQILKRTRLYVEVERFTKGFKALHDASRTLSTSLKIEEIADAFVDLISGMVSSSAVGFFVVDKGKLRILSKKGFEPEKNSFYTKGTFFDFIVRNKQTMHLSRLDGKEGVLPFRINETRTFLGIPIIPGDELFGVLAVTSREPDAISSFQAHLMQTVADQATMYINNAQLHNKVEKLAITDGLTSLYNHKHFQERLNDEFDRIKRIPQTLSLML